MSSGTVIIEPPEPSKPKLKPIKTAPSTIKTFNSETLHYV